MKKNYWLLNRLGNTKVEAGKKYKPSPRGSAVRATINLEGSTLTEVIGHLSDITNTNPASQEEFLDSLTSNLRYASFLALGDNVTNPDKDNYRKIALRLLKSGGFSLKREDNVIQASKQDVSFSLSLDELDSSRLEYQKSFTFKKQAAIIPSVKFVQGLAKQAFDTVMKVKPKDISKAISGFVHSLWFDYAVDKNIYLASMLYHELRESYLPKLQKDFEIKELRYFSSDSRDQKLSNFLNRLTEAIDDGKKVKNIVGNTKKVYPEMSTRDLCDRIILMGELMNLADDKLDRICEYLRDETELEFEFA